MCSNSSRIMRGNNLVFIAAILLPLLCMSYVCESQKGAASSSSNQRWSSKSVSGGQRVRGAQASRAQNSVYGGYQAASEQFQQQQEVPVASSIKNHRTQSNYFQSSSVNRPAVQQPISQQQQQQESSYESASDLVEANAEPASYGSVEGQAGRDFPSYTRVPKTSFTCEGKPHSEFGYYADTETQCQAYHICHNGRKDSFLCGPGTVFNQRILHCDYWYSTDCASSSQYYASSNAYMGSPIPEPGPAQAAGGVAPVAVAPIQRGYSSSSSSSTYNSRRVANNRPAPIVPAANNQFNNQVASASDFNQDIQQVQESY